jgi:type I restriction enzyme M protein
LFRNEEAALRENLIKADLVECVIGLGANLFYNSPMEACIVICRYNKRPNRRGQILIINAVNEVTRKSAQSWLEDSHIKRISDVYENYSDVEGFAKVITIADAKKNDWSLSISLYVREAADEKTIDTRSVRECAAAWLATAFDMKIAYDDLIKLMEDKTDG